MQTLSWCTPELESLFHPKRLEHLAASLPGLFAARDRWEAQPRHVELGAHRAAFLCGLARAHAPQPVVGLEVRSKYVRLAEERIRAAGLSNAHMLCADARLAVPLLLEPESVDAFYVTFPDPWWKERHAGRRFLEPVYLRVLARRLRPGGRLYVKSDVFELLMRTREACAASQAFRPLPPERWPDERMWTWTTREKKCMRAAIPFGRGYYERRRDFASDLPTTPELETSFPVQTIEDPVQLLRGAPPLDVEQRRRRGAPSATAPTE